MDEMRIKPKGHQFLSGSCIENDGYEEQQENLILKVKPMGSEYFDKPFYILVEVRTSKHCYGEDAFTDSQIKIEYSVVNTSSSSGAGIWCGDFRARHTLHDNQISITGGSVNLRPSQIQGNRIGTYFFNRIVTWAKEFEGADVKTIVLSANQAECENKLRRNKFYENFGIRFKYGENDESGSCLPMKTEDLNNVLSWEDNISESSPVGFIYDSVRNKLADDLSIENLKTDNHNLRLRSKSQFKRILKNLFGG